MVGIVVPVPTKRLIELVTSPSSRATPRPPSLQALLAEGRRLDTFSDVLDLIEPRPDDTGTAPSKKNYAQRMSEAAAVLVANGLRDYMPDVLPKADGQGQESRARTGKGVKKLDVNYSTPDLGLGLGVSIKTLNFRDPATARYTKNPTRIDNELRAEAMDYHDRQPYSMLVGILYTPLDACEDGDRTKPKTSRSSFAQIVNVLRHRTGRSAGRIGAKEDPQLFEAFFVGLYEREGDRRGDVRYFDVAQSPPQFGVPATGILDLAGVVRRIVAMYDERNVVKPAWDTGAEVASLDELREQSLLASDQPDEDDENGD